MIFEAVLATAVAITSLDSFDDAPSAPSFEPEPLRLTDIARLEPLAFVSPAALDDDVEQQEESLADTKPHAKFGTRDSWRFGVWTGGGGSTQVNRENWLVIAGVTFSYFVLEDFSLDFEVNGEFVNQEMAADTWGANLTMLFRWHFLSRETWSLYFDGGAGIAYFLDDVPAGGSRFNFSPQAGGGFSLKLNEKDVRLMSGIRWVHYSNGSTQFDNPGIDNFIGYVQVTWPF